MPAQENHFAPDRVKLESQGSRSPKDNVLFVIEALQFICTGLLISDLALAWTVQSLSFTQCLLLTLSVLWLGLVIRLLVMTWRCHHLSPGYENLLVGITGIMVGL